MARKAFVMFAKANICWMDVYRSRRSLLWTAFRGGDAPGTSPGQARVRGDDDGSYLFASAASIAFASAIISGEAPSFSKTLIALDSPFFIKCSPKVS